jgi:hypothetical protein
VATRVFGACQSYIVKLPRRAYSDNNIAECSNARSRTTTTIPLSGKGHLFSAIGYRLSNIGDAPRPKSAPREAFPIGLGLPGGRPSNRLGVPPRGADFGGVRPLCYKGGSLWQKKVSLAAYL